MGIRIGIGDADGDRDWGCEWVGPLKQSMARWALALTLTMCEVP